MDTRNKQGEPVQLPQYKCHKLVRAVKIKEVVYAGDGSPIGQSIPGGGIIVPVGDTFVPFKVSQEYMDRARPQVGGYFVLYEDGYKSYSPAKAFEEGYRLA